MIKLEKVTQQELVEIAEINGYNHFHPDYFKNSELSPVTWLMECILLQIWLRDNHNIHVMIHLDQTMEPKYCYSIHKFIEEEIEWENLLEHCNYSDLYYTDVEALTDGLYYALLTL